MEVLHGWHPVSRSFFLLLSMTIFYCNGKVQLLLERLAEFRELKVFASRHLD